MTGTRTGARGTIPALIPLALLFLAIVTDGFDTAAFAFVVPVLSTEWGLTPADFTVPIVITNIGVVLGYVLCGPLSARLGRRPVVVGAIVFYSLAVVLTPLATSVPMLSGARLLTGIGLGAVLPPAISLAVDLVHQRRRDTVALLITLGLASGALTSGLLGGSIIATWGWAAVFWIPGAVALALTPFLWWTLPRSTPAAASVTSPSAEPAARRGPVALFAGGRAVRTSLLWAFAFLLFLSNYILQSWLPTLLIEFGFEPQQLSLGTAALNFGGIVGGLALALLAAFFGAPRLLIVSSLIAVIAIVSIATLPLATTGILVFAALAGAGMTAGATGQAALAVRIYDDASRTTGVAYAAALGRVGSIIGPAVGGMLLGLGVPATSIILGTAVPVLLAGVIVAIFATLLRRGAPTSAVGAAGDAVGRERHRS